MLDQRTRQSNPRPIRTGGHFIGSSQECVDALLRKSIFLRSEHHPCLYIAGNFRGNGGKAAIEQRLRLVATPDWDEIAQLDRPSLEAAKLTDQIGAPAAEHRFERDSPGDA